MLNCVSSRLRRKSVYCRGGGEPMSAEATGPESHGARTDLEGDKVAGQVQTGKTPSPSPDVDIGALEPDRAEGILPNTGHPARHDAGNAPTRLTVGHACSVAIPHIRARSS